MAVRRAAVIGTGTNFMPSEFTKGASLVVVTGVVATRSGSEASTQRKPRLLSRLSRTLPMRKDDLMALRS